VWRSSNKLPTVRRDEADTGRETLASSGDFTGTGLVCLAVGGSGIGDRAPDFAGAEGGGTALRLTSGASGSESSMPGMTPSRRMPARCAMSG
jgi:hypothetical protein